MATTEQERKTDYICPFCQGNIRKYGRISLGMLKCTNQNCRTYTTLYFEDNEDFDLKKRKR
jgi:ribosomal protein L37AE/L43A